MQEGTEAVQRAIGKPSGRVRRRETLHQHAHIGMKKSSTQSRERVKGQSPLRSPEAEPLVGLVKTNSHKEAPKMAITIALAGNPNCGKTTMFNALTGSRQFVGNWPGVTVEKKEGKLKGNDDVVIQDLPGIYSLSPYTLEEVVARNYLITERPDAILNIMLNVTDGIVVYPKVVRSRLMAELPFMASENIMMQAVEKGGNRQELHERLRQHAIAAGKQVKEEGLPNDMVDRIAADPAFGLTREEIVAGLVPENFVGRAPQQVEEFIANVLKPIFDANPDAVEQHASLSV